MSGAFRWWRWRRQGWLAIIAIIPAAGPSAAAAIALNLVTGVLPLGFMIGTSVAIERVTAAGHSDWGAILAAVVLAVAALGLQTVLAPFQAAFSELISRRVDGACARELMRTTLADAPVDLLEQPDILDQMTEAHRGLMEYFVTPGSAVAGLIALVARYAQLAAAIVIVGITLGPVAVLVIAVAALVPRAGYRTLQAQYAKMYEDAAPAVRKALYIMNTGSESVAAKEIRVLGTLRWWRERGDRDSGAYLHRMWRVRRRVALWPFVFYSLVTLVAGAAVLVMLRDAVGSGRLGVLGLSLTIQALLIPLRFGAYFPESDVQTERGMRARDAMLTIERAAVERSLERRRPGGRQACQVPRSVIAFEKVTFAYPGSDHAVLDELDLELAAGTSTAIVGLNGAGKTTLVKLLSRLYEPTAGRITVDGTPADEFDSRSWQKRLAVIYQDYVRYELNAAANIGLGAPGIMADTGALERAVEWAGAGDVIAELPDGLATVLSARYPGGVDLSGGQWQRIALARALFAVEGGASVLVLDEPTAQLDVRAEVAFFDRFLELTRGLTTVVISHRFSTVRRADRIVVLADGKVTECGSHEELTAAGGRYAELFHLQARRFTEEADHAGGTGEAGEAEETKV
jgi:ATP-binding cassette, subfamily B, bacterial